MATSIKAYGEGSTEIPRNALWVVRGKWNCDETFLLFHAMCVRGCVCVCVCVTTESVRTTINVHRGQSKLIIVYTAFKIMLN